MYHAIQIHLIFFSKLMLFPKTFQPDSSVTPVFDEFVTNGVVQDSFSMQLCGSSEIDPSSEPTVAGTMVSLHRPIHVL